MRRSVFALCAMFCGSPSLVQGEGQTLRNILIHGQDGESAMVVWLHQPGGGLDLRGAIALPCLLADLSFSPSGEIVLADSTQVMPNCPDAIASGERKLTWETVVIERLGVERLRISDTEEKSSCDFAVIETTPALSLATTCDNQDFPRYFRFLPQATVNGETSNGK